MMREIGTIQNCTIILLFVLIVFSCRLNWILIFNKKFRFYARCKTELFLTLIELLYEYISINVHYNFLLFLKLQIVDGLGQGQSQEAFISYVLHIYQLICNQKYLDLQFPIINPLEKWFLINLIDCIYWPNQKLQSTQMKKSVTSVALFISFISMLIIAGIAQLSQEEFYSNKKAYQCFTQNLSQCAQTLDPSCQQVSSQCVKQLSKLSCSFSQDDRIHNGACFRQWEQKAIQTKGFVQCLNSKCDFKYNSAITIQNLEKCTQKTLFQMRAECDDICIDKIRIIHERMTRMPLQTAYSVPLVEDNQAAKKIVEKIRELCIFGDYSQQQNQFESQQPVAQNENEKSKQSQL